MATRRRARGSSADRGQLSFFDTDGELGPLKEEARRLADIERIQAERAVFLQDAIDLARASATGHDEAVAAAGIDALAIGSVSSDRASVTFVLAGASIAISRASEEAGQIQRLLSEHAARLHECAFEVRDEASGFHVRFSAAREAADFWLFPSLQGPSGFDYGAGADPVRVTARTPVAALVAGFDRLVRSVPAELDAYEKALGRSQAEARQYEHQLANLIKPDPAHLEAAHTAIERIESAADGLLEASPQDEAAQPTILAPVAATVVEAAHTALESAADRPLGGSPQAEATPQPSLAPDAASDDREVLRMAIERIDNAPVGWEARPAIRSTAPVSQVQTDVAGADAASALAHIEGSITAEIAPEEVERVDDDTPENLAGAPLVEGAPSASMVEWPAANAPISEAETETDHGVRRGTVEAPERHILGAAQGLSSEPAPENLRGDGEGRDADGVSRNDRQRRSEPLRHAERADGRDSEGDREPGREGGLHQQDSVGGRRNGPDRNRVRQTVEDAAARRRERAQSNFAIRAEHDIGRGGPKQKVAANIAAIRVLKLLQEEQREATDDEKQILVRYVGWGAFAQAIFDKNPRSRHAETWREEREQLTELLTVEEWASARTSTLNAHFTSEEVIRGVWSAVQHLGFTGGRVLEPASGVGHFIGLTPEPLRNEIAWTATELDKLTGGIAKTLYPGADVRVQGFETAKWPDGFFDLAISNVPFGNYGLHDERYPRTMSIHDYFFIRGLDKVRPGGLVAFITSRYTMDKESELIRGQISERAEFLGAIRLPGGRDGAFAQNAGTEATSDIIFLRRRFEGEVVGDESWLQLAEIQTPDGPTKINSYFAKNPAMMLGEMRLMDGQYGPNQPVLAGSAEGLDERITKVVGSGIRAGAFTQRHAAPSAPVAEIHAETDGIKEGAFYRHEGEIYRKVDGIGTRQKLSRPNKAKLTALMDLRDIVNELLRKQTNGDMVGRDDLRLGLNRGYDAFHRRYGPINRTTMRTTARLRKDGTPVILRRMPNFDGFRDDPDAFKVAAIENYDETHDTGTKAAIFSHDIVQPHVVPDVSGPSDALALSLDQTGTVDIPLIASYLDLPEHEAIEALGEQIFLDPVGDVWRTRDDYLSGDVISRLDDARAAAEIDDRYLRNVEALEEVHPAPLTRIDIRVLMGAPWVPIGVYRDFLKETMSISANELMLTAHSKKWAFLEKPAIPESARAAWGTTRSTVDEIILAALNNGEIRVMDKLSDGSSHYNLKASEESNTKVAALREAFSGSPAAGVEGWIWQDDKRAQMLEPLYNRKFNRLKPRVYDGGHQTMPGIVRYVTSDDGRAVPFKLHPHQKNGVWRIVSSGNTLLDHCVGAGKTYTMIAAGMEQKRLGLIQRPLYVVPNHMLEQFSREFLQAYPSAKILVADKESMSANRRREFAARVAAERWDGIVMTHDAFGRIPMSDEVYNAHIKRELDEVIAFKERVADEEGQKSLTVKELEKTQKRLAASLEERLGRDRKDTGITFEELQVDFLFVDEAHAFKNLEFLTRHKGVKGIGARAAKRATDLLLKIRYLDGRRPGRSVVFATGTPVSNTIAEMYTMQRYLQPATLEGHGLAEFDAWAATYGEIATRIELAPSGKGFRTVRSFATFVNVPELIQLYSCVADTQTAEMLKLPRPELETGMVQIVESEMSEREKAIMDSLVARADKLKGKRPEKGGDHILKIMGEGLKLATDIRLLDPDAPANPEGKIARATDNIVRIWREGVDPGLAQIVFLDMGVPGSKAKQRTTLPRSEVPDVGDEAVWVDKSFPWEQADETSMETDDQGDDDDGASVESPLADSRFNLYASFRDGLIAKGIPAAEIAFIHDANTDEKKARLFAAVRAGRIRVLIGSTAKMGVGTNVQERLVAMHHIDAPWRPADVEQRDGRILRQGNLNKTVAIYRYITIGSLDAYRWQILLIKALFIAMLRAGARGVREAEDIDSPLPEAEMIKAAATGDNRMMEQAALSKEIRELEAGRRGHERSQDAARNAHSEILRDIEKRKIRIAEMEIDAGSVADLSGDRFEMVLKTGENDPIVMRDRKMAGAMLKRHLLRDGAGIWETRTVQQTVGEISGIGMMAGLTRIERRDLQIVVSLKGRNRYTRNEFFPLSETTDEVGLIRRFESLLKTISSAAEENRKELARVEADLPRIERQMVRTPFAKQDRLTTAKARLAALDSELQAEETARTASPVAPPAPVAEAEAAHALPEEQPDLPRRNSSPSVVAKHDGFPTLQDHVRGVADRLIEQLQQHTAPWLKPWAPGARFMPYNPASGVTYKGSNAMVLLSAAAAAGYDDGRWMTYRQAASQGAQVRFGERGVKLQSWDLHRERPEMFSSVVFNASQIDGLPREQPRPLAPEWQRHELAEAIIAGSGVEIRHETRDRASYNLKGDFIVLPPRAQFARADLYYACAIHELCHATAHKTRLDRDISAPFGSDDYAREELRAEIASMRLGAQLGIGYDPRQHVSYIGKWADILQRDPMEIFRAAADAEAIVTFVRGFGQEKALEKAVTVASAAQQADEERSDARTYIAVPYKERDLAWNLGAEWDRQAKCWFVPPGMDLAKFAQWAGRPTSEIDADPHVAFGDAIRDAGLKLDGLPIMDGNFHRLAVDSDKGRETSGSYRGFSDGLPNGRIWNRKAGIDLVWKSQIPVGAISAADRAQLTAEWAATALRREHKRMALAEETANLISAHMEDLPFATEAHPYLARKGVRAHGLFVNTADALVLRGGEKDDKEPQHWSAEGHLLVPVCDIDGALLSAQSIAPSGMKSFPRGGAWSGGHHLIGDVAAQGRLLVVEGYATGATLHETTTLPVAVAFSAGNLEAVAAAYRERFPHLRIIVAGDNDHAREREIGADGLPKKNVGKDSAEAAAKAVGGVALIPPFEAKQKGSDWNDLAKIMGEDFKPLLRGAFAVAERRQIAITAEAEREANTQAQTVEAEPAPARARVGRR